MLLLKLLQFSILIGLVYVVITQIIIPAFYGRQLFPLFKKQNTIEAKIAENMQKRYEKELERKLRNKYE